MTDEFKMCSSVVGLTVLTSVFGAGFQRFKGPVEPESNWQTLTCTVKKINHSVVVEI